MSVEDLSTALVEFRSVAIGTLNASWAATGHKRDLGFSVVGTQNV